MSASADNTAGTGVMTLRCARFPQTSRYLAVAACSVEAVLAPAITTRAANPFIGANQFSNDPNLIVPVNGTSGSVDDSESFPDGNNRAACFIKVTRTGEQPTPNYYGNCVPTGSA
jgi:hypothetical protein